MKLETELASGRGQQEKPELINLQETDSSLGVIDHLFKYEDGSIHPVKMTLTGITIGLLIVLGACIACYCSKGEKCSKIKCDWLTNACSNICRTDRQTKKSVMIENFVNTIKLELENSNQQVPDLDI